MPSLSIILLAMLIHRQRNHDRVSFRNQLSVIARRRRDRRITRVALQNPSVSPFMVLFQSLCDQSLITVTGFDHSTFIYLLNRFAPLYNRFTPYAIERTIRVIPTTNRGRGRPRSISAIQCLRLILTRHRTRGSMRSLCMLFGVTASVCSLFIRFGRCILLRIFSSDTNATVRMPNEEEIEQYTTACFENYSSLKHVYAVADGLKLYLEQSGDFVIQNMFYKGWAHNHYVGNVLVFAPSGTIIACAANAPGSMHDSQIAEWGNVYEKLEQCHRETGGQCVVDSAFAQGAYPFLIKSAQDETGAEGVDEFVKIRQATSARQASEWGMRAFQGSFPRMKDRFVYEENGERKLVLLCTVHLFNRRARLVGINQILSSYMPRLSVEANLFLQDTLHL